MALSLTLASNVAFPSLVSTTSNQGSYIVSLASITSSTYAALATNTSEQNAILIYSMLPTGLSRIKTLPMPSGNIPTFMRVIENFNGRPMLMSAHQDPGCIKVWDERMGGPVVDILSPKSHSVLSFDASRNGTTLAGGSDLKGDDASIFYWDPRNTSTTTHIHSSTHSDDITALHFHPTSHEVLLSASSDGLLSLSNANEVDEDESVQEVANWGCSIAKAGWFGAEVNIWASSDMETFGVWDSNLNLLVDYGDIRRPNLPNRWSTDYFVDVRDTSNSGPCGMTGLSMFLGSNSGDMALASVDPVNYKHNWNVYGFLRGGHADSVVRSALWDSKNDIILTGDEEGRLAAWRPSGGSSNADNDVEMEEAEPVNVGNKRSRKEDQTQQSKKMRYGNNE